MDARLQEILLDYGLEGYGLYWYCIELITQKIDSDNITFELEHDARIIARNTGSSVQKVQEMMTRFVEIGLFENSNGVITCLKLAKRLDKSMTNSPAMRQFIEDVRTRHDIVRKCQPRIEEDKKKNRIDKSKANAKKSAQMKRPTLQEVQSYFNEIGSTTCLDDGERFFDHFESNGWKVGGKTPMKDWKAAVRNWFKRNKEYSNGQSLGSKATLSNLNDTDW